MAWEYEVHELSEGVSAIVYDEHGQRIADHLAEERAALIAAAPDLLSTVIECRKQIDTIIEDGTPTDWRMWRDDLDALIAKATPLTEQQRGRVEA